MKKLAMFIIVVLLFTTNSKAQIEKAGIDIAIKKLDDVIDTAAKLLDKKIDSAVKLFDKKIDTVSQSSNNGGLFDASDKARKNPTYLYKSPCDTCITGCKTSKVVKSANVTRLFAWVILAFIIVFGFWAFKKTALCRDESYIRNDNQLLLRSELERPYSYARVQLFWWTMIVSSCYTVFFALYGNLLPLNATCIILLGGVIATQLLGKVIDESQLSPNSNGVQTLPNADRHQDINTSKNFLTDILSDDQGVSIHRLQGVIFNLIYGLGFVGYFIVKVNCYQYPLIDFEPWQFTLLGISISGYLGLKATENNPASRATRRQLP
jgi:hypothetical protein